MTEVMARKMKNMNFAKELVAVVCSFAHGTVSPLTKLEFCHHQGQWMVERPQATVF